MLRLASTSATRKALLTGAGLVFESSPAPIDERAEEARALGKAPEALARHLAEAKARAVSRLHPADIVIGADQILALDSEILHKPEGLAGARRQLDRLRGRAHSLVSAVALCRNGTVLFSATDAASLTMRAFSEAERDHVLALEGEAVLGSVGSYRLEGPSIRLFERVEGDYFTILGLPLLPLLAGLRQHAPETFERFT
jgi:septum formation protein